MSSGVYTPIEWQKSVNKSQIYNKKSEFFTVGLSYNVLDYLFRDTKRLFEVRK